MKKAAAYIGFAWAASACVCGGQVVTTGLLAGFDANLDTNPNNGWNYTGSMGPGTLPLSLNNSGAMTREQDPNGQWYFSHSSDDKFFIGNVVTPRTISDYTMEYWIRQTGQNSENHISGARDIPGNEFISLQGNGGAVTMWFSHRDFDGTPDGSNRSTESGFFSWPLNGWQQFVITYIDASSQGAGNGMLAFYVNNSLIFQATNHLPFHNNQSLIRVLALLGNVEGEAARTMVGDMAVFRMYDQALTPAEIEQNFNATGFGLGLVSPPLPPPAIAAVALTDPVALRFTGDLGQIYELHGSDDGTTFTGTGALVRGAGAEQVVFDPSGSQKAAYRMIRQ